MRSEALGRDLSRCDAFRGSVIAGIGDSVKMGAAVGGESADRRAREKTTATSGVGGGRRRREVVSSRGSRPRRPDRTPTRATMSLHTASTSPASGGSLSADALVPTHLWIVGGLSLLRNALGAFDYVMTPMQVEAYMSAFTAGQLRYFYSFPAWVDAAWAVAASLVGLAGSTTYTTLFTNGMQIDGRARRSRLLGRRRAGDDRPVPLCRKSVDLGRAPMTTRRRCGISKGSRCNNDGIHF